MMLARFDKWDWLWSLMLAAAVLLAVMFTSHLVGLVRDEGFYMRTAETTADYLQFSIDSIGRGQFTEPFSKKTITRFFEFNSEHPTFVKNLFGLSHFIFYKKLQWLSFVNSIRLVAALFAAATAFLIYLFGRLFFSRMTAIASPLLFFTMPHIFFHSHLACFDIPILFFWSGTFILFAVYLVNRSRWLAFFIAVFLGCAMATKHNVYFIPPLLVLIWLVMHFATYRSLDPRHKGFVGFFRAVPLPFWFMPLVSLPVFFISWPWLWYDTIKRFGNYLAFHAYHVHYTNYYFGQELSSPPFPFSYPWGMTFFTTPVPQLVCFFAAAALFLYWLFGRGHAPLQRHVGAVLLAGALFPILLISMPGVPIFGGIKHFFTGQPILLTAGLAVVLNGAAELSRRWPKVKERAVQGIVVAAALLALIAPNAKFVMHGAGFFNALIGGAQGAAGNYMQRNFWGYDILPLCSVLNTVAPRGARVFVMSYAEGLNWNSFLYLKKEGFIRNDIQGTNELRDADLAFFFYEKQNENVLYDLYREFGTARPLELSETDSVYFSALFGRVK